ncbi:MAG: hypothetical protein WCB90_07990, partial [Methanosarcina sp.]
EDKKSKEDKKVKKTNKKDREEKGREESEGGGSYYRCCTPILHLNSFSPVCSLFDVPYFILYFCLQYFFLNLVLQEFPFHAILVSCPITSISSQVFCFIYSVIVRTQHSKNYNYKSPCLHDIFCTFQDAEREL